MHIVLCLDYSSHTQKILTDLQAFAQSFKEYDLSVIHIIDETLFSAGTGAEVRLEEDLKKDSENLRQLVAQSFGENAQYTEAFGIPRQKIDEILAGLNYDLLVIGNHSRNLLGSWLLGGIAEHLIRNSAKPVLIIQ